MATAKKKTIRTIPQERTPMREQDPKQRARNFREVAIGYSLEDTLREAEREAGLEDTKKQLQGAMKPLDEMRKDFDATVRAAVRAALGRRPAP